MNSKIDELISMVESLPSDVKISLLEKILESFHPTQKEIDYLWCKEAETRVKEIQSGKIKPIAGDEVFQAVKERFSR